MTREQVFNALQQRDVTRAVVEFSGGNDEGGADAIYLINDTTGGRIEIDEDYEDFGPALAEPIYRRYHSFAGDFFVSGEVEWRVADRTVIMHGEPV